MKAGHIKNLLRTATAGILCAGLMTPALTVFAAAEQEVIKVACVGDSITAGSHASDAAHAYPAVLQSLLGDGYEVRNFGVSGRTLMDSGDNPYTEMPQYEQSKAWLPDVVILMLGTNDSKAVNFAHKEEFVDDLEAMIQSYQALSSQPTVVVATSPTAFSTAHGISNDNLEELVVLQKQTAAKTRCPVIDIHALTAGRAGLFDDGVHCTDEGYAVLAGMMRDGLAAMSKATVDAFVIDGKAAEIDNEHGAIMLYLPADADLSALTPDITLPIGAEIDKSGPQDFTNAVTYTVSSADGTVSRTFSAVVRPYPADIFAKDVIRVACVGDSITAGVGASGGQNYVNRLQQALGSRYQVRNFGFSGGTVQRDGKDNPPDTKNYGYVNQPAYTQSQSYQPDIVLFMLGGNDSRDSNWRNNPNNTFEADYRALINSYLSLDSRPLVIVGITPAIAHDQWNLRRDVVNEEIVPLEKRILAEMGMETVDMHALTVDRPELYTDDGVHPNDAGHAALAQAFANKLQSMAATAADNKIAGFSLAGAEGVIDHETGAIHVSLPVGTDRTALEPCVDVATGATVSPLGERDFTQPQSYLVTAADGSERRYTVSVTQQRAIRVACVGDSVTAGGFPAWLQTILGDGYIVGNFGENSTTVLKTGKKETGDGRGAYIYHDVYTRSLAFQPDIVISLLGSNDSKLSGGTPGWVDNWTADNKGAFSRDYEELLQSYRALPSKPVVMIATSPKAYSTSWGARDENLEKEIVPAQRALAEKLSCPLIDIRQLTIDRPSIIGGDGLHPNDNGTYAIAAAYAEAISALNLTRELAISALQVSPEPDKVTYAVGEALDLTGGYLSVTYEDSSFEDIPLTEGMVSGYHPEKPGVQTLTVTFAGKTATFEVTVTDTTTGDINNDGVVNTTDARLALQHAVEKISLNEAQLAVGDVDGNGVVNTTDARLILQYAVEKIDKFPAEK